MGGNFKHGIIVSISIDVNFRQEIKIDGCIGVLWVGFQE
jgi:hypothetical protein